MVCRLGAQRPTQPLGQGANFFGDLENRYWLVHEHLRKPRRLPAPVQVTREISSAQLVRHLRDSEGY